MTQNAWDSPNLTADGQVLIGDTAGGRPVAGFLTGCGIDVTNAANSITLDTISTGLDYDKISASTASTSSTIEFTGLSSSYHAYKVEISDMVPETDGTLLYMRTSTDNGSSFDSTSGDYMWAHMGVDNDGNLKDDGDGSDTKMILIGRTNDPIGNDTNETTMATVWIFNPSSTSWTKAFCQSEYVRTNGDCWLMFAAGTRTDTTAVNAIQFLMDSDAILSGTFTLYGLKA